MGRTGGRKAWGAVAVGVAMGAGLVHAQETNGAVPLESDAALEWVTALTRQMGGAGGWRLESAWSPRLRLRVRPQWELRLRPRVGASEAWGAQEGRETFAAWGEAALHLGIGDSLTAKLGIFHETWGPAELLPVTQFGVRDPLWARSPIEETMGRLQSEIIWTGAGRGSLAALLVSDPTPKNQPTPFLPHTTFKGVWEWDGGASQVGAVWTLAQDRLPWWGAWLSWRPLDAWDVLGEASWGADQEVKRPSVFPHAAGPLRVDGKRHLRALLGLRFNPEAGGEWRVEGYWNGAGWTKQESEDLEKWVSFAAATQSGWQEKDWGQDLLRRRYTLMMYQSPDWGPQKKIQSGLKWIKNWDDFSWVSVGQIRWKEDWGEFFSTGSRRFSTGERSEFGQGEFLGSLTLGIKRNW